MSVKKASWEEGAGPSRGVESASHTALGGQKGSQKSLIFLQPDLLERGGSVEGVRASAAMLIGTAVW